MKKMILPLIAAAAITTTLFAQTETTTAPAETTAKTTITIDVHPNTPMIYQATPGGPWTGYLGAHLDAIQNPAKYAEEYGLDPADFDFDFEINFRNIANLGEVMDGVRNGTANAATGALNLNSSRLPGMLAVSYFDGSISMVVKKGTPAAAAAKSAAAKEIAPDDFAEEFLADKTVATKADSSNQDLARDFSSKPVVTKLDVNSAIEAMLAGKADVVIYDSPSLFNLAQTTYKGQIEVVGSPFRYTPYAIYVPANNVELFQKLQRAFTLLREAGFSDEVYFNYFGHHE